MGVFIRVHFMDIASCEPPSTDLKLVEMAHVQNHVIFPRVSIATSFNSIPTIY